MAKLTGTNPEQVPTNADLGDMAYKDGKNLQAGPLTITDGKVGIGDVSPSYKLDVVGNAQLNPSSNPVLRFSESGTVRGLLTSSASIGLGIETSGALPFRVNTNGSERMRIDSSGNVGINTTDPDLYATSSTLLHIVGNASNSGPAGLMMTGQSASQGQAFYSQEVFQVNFGGSVTEFCRFTGTGANGYQAYFKIIVTGHEGTHGNGTTIKEYIWGGQTTSPTQLSTTTNGQAPVISFDNTTSNVCIIKLASANGNGFNGVMKVEWMNPLDFASSTYTVS